jgi:transposase
MTSSKTDALREAGTLNPHPETVTDSLFREGEFFDPSDVVQVKYEMLRRVRVDGQPVGKTAADFGFSRPTYYEAQAAFADAGIAALVPKKRGPRGPHKLADEVLAFVRAEVSPSGPMRAAELARRVQDRFGLSVHPRTIERALAQEKKRH